MMMILLKKAFYMPGIRKYQLMIKRHKSPGLRHFNDPKGLWNTQMIWMIFMKILKNTIQLKKVNY